MWNFEREEIADKAIAYIEEKNLKYSPLSMVIALDALGLLKDPAVEHGVQSDGAVCVCFKNQFGEIVKLNPQCIAHSPRR